MTEDVDAALEALMATIDKARLRAEDGLAVDLSGLEQDIRQACRAVGDLERAEGRTLLPRLQALGDGLDALKAALKNQPRATTQPGAVARRVVGAYGQPK